MMLEQVVGLVLLGRQGPRVLLSIRQMAPSSPAVRKTSGAGGARAAREGTCWGAADGANRAEQAWQGESYAGMEVLTRGDGGNGSDPAMVALEGADRLLVEVDEANLCAGGPWPDGDAEEVQQDRTAEGGHDVGGVECAQGGRRGGGAEQGFQGTAGDRR